LLNNKSPTFSIIVLPISSKSFTISIPLDGLVAKSRQFLSRNSIALLNKLCKSSPIVCFLTAVRSFLPLYLSVKYLSADIIRSYELASIICGILAYFLTSVAHSIISFSSLSLLSPFCMSRVCRIDFHVIQARASVPPPTRIAAIRFIQSDIPIPSLYHNQVLRLLC